MAQKAATLEIPELMQFLRQQLHDLPDERNPGNNTRYQIEDAMMATQKDNWKSQVYKFIVPLSSRINQGFRQF